MAVFDFDFPDNMFDDVLNIFDETAPKMIDEALPIYESAVKSELQPHRDTGELISSIKCKKAKKTVNGAYIGYLTAEGASRLLKRNLIFIHHQEFLKSQANIRLTV